MKSIEQILKLSENPFYKLSPQEQAQLESHMRQEAGDESKKKSSTSINKQGNATVKEIGKLNKHIDDPVTE